MKKNLLIFSVALILYFFTKIVIFIIEGLIDISFYSITAYISMILYIVIFIKLFKVINYKKSKSLPNLSKSLYNVSILLLINSILASTVEIIKTFKMVSSIYNESNSGAISMLGASLLREVGLIGYLTASLCFFLVTKLFYDKSSNEF